jgi:hypothetical protein
MTLRETILLAVIVAALATGVGSGTVAGEQAETVDINKLNPNVEGDDSEEARIDITVVDTSGNPIEGALVELEDRGGSPDNRLATTGSDGQIRFVEGTGPPPANCQTAKLRLEGGGTQSADLGCSGGGESSSYTFQVDRSGVETSLNKVNPNVEGDDSEEARIDITVVDTSGNPIEGALVELEDRGGSPDNRLATTGSDGQIRFVEGTGPPPANCQTAKLRLEGGGTQSADLGCSGGGESSSYIFQVDSAQGGNANITSVSPIPTDGQFTISYNVSGGNGHRVELSPNGPSVNVTGYSGNDDFSNLDGTPEETDSRINPDGVALFDSFETGRHTITVDVSGGTVGDSVEIEISSLQDQTVLDTDRRTVSITDEHPSGVSQALFDAVAEQNADVDTIQRSDVTDMINAFFTARELDGIPINRSDVTDIIDWFFSN